MFKIALVVAAASTEAKLLGSPADKTAFAEFQAWSAKFGKVYSSPEESLFRAGVFAANKGQIDSHNKLYESGVETFTMGVNAFTDLTHAEFKSRYLGGKKPRSLASVTPEEAGVPPLDMSFAPPASVDWREKGAVTPVKDQGQCGSCWAFATTVATEGSTFVNSSKLLSLSEEQIVECDLKNGDGNDGCK